MNRWGWLAFGAAAATVVSVFVVLLDPTNEDPVALGAGQIVMARILFLFGVWATVGLVASLVVMPRSDDPVTRLGQVMALVALLAQGAAATIIGLSSERVEVSGDPFVLSSAGLFWLGLLVMVAGRLTRSTPRVEPGV